MADWTDVSDEDERAAAAFMARVAALPGPAALRNPSHLWWKGQLVRRWDAERQAQQPLDVMERVEIAAGLAAAAGLLLWIVPTVTRIITAPFMALLG
jgi:hypothetical protein